LVAAAYAAGVNRSLTHRRHLGPNNLRLGEAGQERGAADYGHGAAKGEACDGSLFPEEEGKVEDDVMKGGNKDGGGLEEGL